MRDPFLQQQWHELIERLQHCASHIAHGDPSLASKFSQQASAFAEHEPPQRYPQFLERVREAAGIAIQWQEQWDRRSDLDHGDAGVGELVQTT